MSNKAMNSAYEVGVHGLRNAASKHLAALDKLAENPEVGTDEVESTQDSLEQAIADYNSLK